MSTDIFGQRRLEPLHSPVPQVHEPETSQETNALQPDAAVTSDVHVDAPPKVEDYTISVEQVREHFRSKGLTKSKDTIQRWCRAGDLDCQKRGVLGRYFTTETSLLKLEQKLLPDMIAENAGAAVVQPDAAAPGLQHSEMQVYAAEVEPARSDMQADEVVHAAANSDMAEAPRPAPLHAGEELATLRAENAGLKEQLKAEREVSAFFREEITSARGQRGDVVKIAEQMLGTLETIAIGGRLDRPKQQGSGANQSGDFVRYAPQGAEGDSV